MHGRLVTRDFWGCPGGCSGKGPALELGAEERPLPLACVASAQSFDGLTEQKGRGRENLLSEPGHPCSPVDSGAPGPLGPQTGWGTIGCQALPLAPNPPLACRWQMVGLLGVQDCMG